VSSTRVGDAENGGTHKDDTRFSWTSLLRRVLDTEHSAYKVRQRTSVMLFMMASQSPSHKNQRIAVFHPSSQYYSTVQKLASTMSFLRAMVALASLGAFANAEGLCTSNTTNTFTVVVDLFASELGKKTTSSAKKRGASKGLAIGNGPYSLLTQYKWSILCTHPNTYHSCFFLVKSGYYTFEECPGMISPTIGMEIGTSYTFVQSDISNWMHPMVSLFGTHTIRRIIRILTHILRSFNFLSNYHHLNRDSHIFLTVRMTTRTNWNRASPRPPPTASKTFLVRLRATFEATSSLEWTVLKILGWVS